MTRRCISCGEDKDDTQFLIRKAAGYTEKRCKPCHYAARGSRTAEYLFRAAFYGRKRAAKALCIPFTITLASLYPLPEVCPVLGIPLHHGEGRNEDGSYSIDRMVPAEGYTPENTIVISLKANRIKNNGTPDEIIRVGQFFKDRLK